MQLQLHRLLELEVIHYLQQCGFISSSPYLAYYLQCPKVMIVPLMEKKSSVKPPHNFTRIQVSRFQHESLVTLPCSNIHLLFTIRFLADEIKFFCNKSWHIVPFLNVKSLNVKSRCMFEQEKVPKHKVRSIHVPQGTCGDGYSLPLSHRVGLPTRCLIVSQQLRVRDLAQGPTSESWGPSN